MRNRLAARCGWLIIVGLIGAQPASAGADDKFKQALSELATREGQRLLDGQRLPLDLPAFKGTLHAVNPKDDFRATISEFTLTNDQIRATVSLTGSFQIAGAYKTDSGGTFDLSARMKISLTVSGLVEIDFQDRDLILKPRVTDFDARVLEVADIKPDDLAGGKALIARLLNNAVRKQKEALLRYVNDNLKESRIK